MQTCCELCGFDGSMDPVYPNYGIMACPNCSLVFYSGEADPKKLYNKEYFHGGEYRNYLGDKSILQRNFLDRIKLLRKFNSTGRLLEIGSAYGFFLDLARHHWQVRGTEIAPEPAAYAREYLDLDVECVDFVSLLDEPDEYDIICMWDTIEHLNNPVSYLDKAHRWLKPEGIIAITTGDIGSLLARFQGERWRLIHPPTHLFYFSKETLSRALVQCGMEVVHFSHVGYRRGIKAMIYGLLGENNKREWLHRLLDIGGTKDMSVYLNLYDIMLVVARKSPTS